MMTGTQLIAPNGYQSLAANVTYYFLSNYADRSVNLVWFWKSGRSQPNGVVIRLPRSQFEEALLTKGIVIAQQQRTTPFWFGDTSYEDLSAADFRRAATKKTLTEHVDERYLAIAPLLDRERERAPQERNTRASLVSRLPGIRP